MVLASLPRRGKNSQENCAMHVSKVFPSLRDTLPRDLMASVVVFLVALPLCMGIAIASGMPPAKGLLTGIVGGLVVGFLA
ncbi:hypothetical protein ALP65_04439, partial [Pseudomonas aeruginosa]